MKVCKGSEKRETLLNVSAEDFMMHLRRTDSDEDINPFLLTLAVAKRARQLVDDRVEIRRNGENPAELYHNFWPVAIACEELYEGKVQILPKN